MKLTLTKLLTIALSLALVVPTVLSCTKEQKDDPGGGGGGGGGDDPQPTDTLSYAQWIERVKTRAAALSSCQWTALQDVYTKTTVKYPAGTQVNGVPYGGCRETSPFCTMVGTYVSFYTFLSAVNNPKSILYKSSASQTVGRVVYGNVCTSCVGYCWGVPSYFDTRYVYPEKVPYVKRFYIENNDVEQLQLADAVCWYLDSLDNGHIFVITDVTRDSKGKLVSISTTEAQDGRVHVDTYTKAQFQTFLNTKDKNVKKLNNTPDVGIKFFRFNWESYRKYAFQTYDYNEPKSSGYTFPDALCVDRGDKISYPKGSTVVVNVLKTGYAKLKLYKDNSLYATKTLTGTDKTDDVALTSLPVGMYKACLTDSNEKLKSSYTYFQVGETAFTATKQGDKVVIKYKDANSEIQFIESNKSKVYGFVERVKNGEYVYTWPLDGTTAITVLFAGKYSLYQGAKVTIK